MGSRMEKARKYALKFQRNIGKFDEREHAKSRKRLNSLNDWGVRKKRR